MVLCSESLFFYANAFKVIAYLIFYKDQCIWFYGGVHLDSLGFGFVQNDKYGFICILLHPDIQFGQQYLVKRLFSLFSLCVF